MIRFVDMTASYYSGPKTEDLSEFCCSFLDTVTDRFLWTVHGDHLFGLDEILKHEQSERLLALVPEEWCWK